MIIFCSMNCKFSWAFWKKHIFSVCIWSFQIFYTFLHLSRLFSIKLETKNHLTCSNKGSYYFKWKVINTKKKKENLLKTHHTRSPNNYMFIYRYKNTFLYSVDSSKGTRITMLNWNLIKWRFNIWYFCWGGLVGVEDDNNSQIIF